MQQPPTERVVDITIIGADRQTSIDFSVASAVAAAPMPPDDASRSLTATPARPSPMA
jgi:hypothetical protein